MIVRKSERAIRSEWMNHPDAGGLILNADLGVMGTNLKAKLLVFRNRTCLKRFWDKALGRKQSGWPGGVVSELGCEVIRFRKGKPDLHIHEVDPKYYCVIGLVKGWLTMEVICHEAVHAAYNFAKRIKKTPWDHCKKELDEEEICYPAGKIASEINRVLHDQGLYD